MRAGESTFKDFAEFSNDWDCSQSKVFWKQYLTPVESPSIFPLLAGSAESANTYSPGMSVSEFEIDAATTNKLKAFASDNTVSLNSILQSAWALLLHHYSQQEVVVFGTTRAVRHAMEDSNNVVGLLINTVPFVVQFNTSLTVKELLSQVYQQQKSLRGHEITPLTTIQEYGEVGSGALFDSLVVFDDKCLDTRMSESGIQQKERRHFDYEGQTNFPLSLIAYGETPMQVRIEYDPSKISDSVAQNLSAQLVTLFTGFLETPDNSVVSLPYLTEPELNLLALWNDSDRPYNNDRTLHEIFEAQVERTPDAPALWLDGQTMSYREMNDRANAFAHILRDKGVRPDELVGVYAYRSFEMLIGIYAVIKAGSAYVPFDPEFPQGRLAFMVQDSGARIIVSPTNIAKDFPDTTAEVITLSIDTPAEAVEPLPAIANSKNLAYMLYTSGSTGQPKGAMIEHRSIVNRILWMQEAFGLDQTDTVFKKRLTVLMCLCGSYFGLYRWELA